MVFRITLIIIFVALAQSRLNLNHQEQEIVSEINALRDLDAFNEIPNLVELAKICLKADTNPCQKLLHADKIAHAFHGHERAIVVARKLIAAEQETDPSVTKYPIVCGEPSLPKTPSLRGVIPKVDPAVPNAEEENNKSDLSVVTPFPAVGYSIAQVMNKQGFTNFGARMLNNKILVHTPDMFEKQKASSSRPSIFKQYLRTS